MMRTPDEILAIAKEVILTERSALDSLISVLNENFVKLVHLILHSNGKVILTGVGKSGLIARKIAATLSSTGTLAIFLHPTEGLHGDVGIVRPGDICILLSKSGETEELIAILPILKKIGATTVAITQNERSELANLSDIYLPLGDIKEAGLSGLTPTSSTTATLALGDALAIVLMTIRGFQPEDFAKLHPGGSLGKKLLLKVDDLMHKGEENPTIQANATIQDAIKLLTSIPLGAVSIVDEDGKLIGFFTDGDLRRSILKFGSKVLLDPISEVMTKNPVTAHLGMLALEALRLMENRPSQISVLPVVDTYGKAIGMLRLHDLLAAGLPSTSHGNSI
ncbi:MAG: KpsF/GutQ family sugar-phosphate isomerase [bacterium]|nr:KpsF/GutQ family sugar-phosphate isomerase [bacterium]